MIPVTIDGCYGVVHPACGRHGVVICASLGDEELNTYRAQVCLAERLAKAGFPVLRISYFGTADSAGDENAPNCLRAWIDSIIAAAHWLRATYSVSSISLCGLRVGALLAAAAASEIDNLDALVMLAPVISGRRFLREQILTARTIADIWQSSGEIDDGQWFEAYGLRIDHATRDALDALDLRNLPTLPVRRALLLGQPGTAAGNLSEILRAAAIPTTNETFDSCDRLLRDSHEAQVPHVAFERVVAWLGDPGVRPRADPAPRPACLNVSTCREIPVCLGPEGQLAGILALPPQRDDTLPVVLMSSTGANPRFGNARGIVSLARWLAEQGIVSLRMDGHGIGDAAPATGECGQPYSKQGDADVSHGVDYLATRFGGPVIVFGMCSGAYHAFQAALNDERINGLVLVNLQKFVWRGHESLSVVQRTTLRTTGFYLRNICTLAVWRRLLLGRVNIAGIARALASRAVLQLAAAAAPAIAAIGGETTVGMVRRQFDELAQRRVQILYVLSGNDPGHDEIAEYFGPRGWQLRRKANVLFHTIKGADHTLSAYWTRQRLRQITAMYLRQRFGIAIHVDDAPANPTRGGAQGRRRITSTARPPRGSVIDSAPTAA